VSTYHAYKREGLRQYRASPLYVSYLVSEVEIIQVKGFREIPFLETDIESVDADGEPWNVRGRAVRTRNPQRK